MAYIDTECFFCRRANVISVVNDMCKIWFYVIRSGRGCSAQASRVYLFNIVVCYLHNTCIFMHNHKHWKLITLILSLFTNVRSGGVSIDIYHLISLRIILIKIRRSSDHRKFIMGFPRTGQTVSILKRAYTQNYIHTLKRGLTMPDFM